MIVYQNDKERNETYFNEKNVQCPKTILHKLNVSTPLLKSMSLEQKIIFNPVDRFIVATSKLPAASTLYTKGMLFANV